MLKSLSNHTLLDENKGKMNYVQRPFFIQHARNIQEPEGLP